MSRLSDAPARTPVRQGYCGCAYGRLYRQVLAGQGVGYAADRRRLRPALRAFGFNDLAASSRWRPILYVAARSAMGWWEPHQRLAEDPKSGAGALSSWM